MDMAREWLAGLPAPEVQAAEAAIKLNGLVVFVQSPPKGKGRPRFTRQGRCYTPDTTRKAEDEAQWAAREQGCGLLGGAIGVLLLAVFPIPSSWSKKKRQDAGAGIVRPAVKPDFDNVAKLYCDALNELMWEDDKQIVDGRCIKVYGQQPGGLVVG